MTYEVLQCDTLGGLVNTVQTYWDIGWRPMGGISQYYLPNGQPQFLQAMVKPALGRPPKQGAKAANGQE